MRVFYWSTCCLQPEIEAISKEVFQLANHFCSPLIFSINPHCTLSMSFRKKYVGVHPALDLPLRILIPLLEKWADINHVYGEITPWTFYKSLRKKPTVLTIASEKGVMMHDFLLRCKKIIVQTETFRKKLVEHKIPRENIELIYPSINLQYFTPRPATDIEHPKILFATAPRSKDELEKRGVLSLLHAAQLNSSYQYRLLYRQWRKGYTSLQATQQLIQDLNLKNVELTNSNISHMPSLYRDYDLLVIPYTTIDGGKECPNSCIEAIACGLPVIISSVAPFSYFIEKHKCGVVFEAKSPQSLVAAIQKAKENYQLLSHNAVLCAKRHFDITLAYEKMRKIYSSICG